MENNSSFFSNRACAYFPCHKVNDIDSFNCLFCYCPLYMLGDQCGGKFTYTAKGIKNCTDCVIPHAPKAAEYIYKRFADIAKKAGIAPSVLDTKTDLAEFETLGGEELFDALNKAIAPLDEAAQTRAKAHWDSIAKPLDGLGKLEKAIAQIAGITGDENVHLEKRAVAVCCADNGIVEEGVTQTDASVTATMAQRISEHRSSVCLMAKSASADVFAFDLGMLRRVEGVTDLSVGNGTANMAKGPAMTREQAETAIRNGIRIAKMMKKAGYKILVTGEMGIGNTSTSSAVASVLLGLPVEEVTGRGAGLSDEGLNRKRSALKRAIEINSPDPKNAFDVLQKVGGFDLAGLAGLYIGAALCRIPILIDGLPSSVAALIAARLVPNSKIAMLPSHCSAEPVAKAILSDLGLEAMLFADMKLGEGTGAVCMLPLFDEALSVYHGSVTFEDTAIEQYVPQGGNAK